jgi:hypothetical protein
MAGLSMEIPTVFTNPDLPYFRDDPVLPRQGAMMLIDPMHPAGAWAAGVPADQALLPNLAGTQLSALLTAPVAADLQPKMFKPAAFTGAAGLLERTTKGGLHGISPKSGAAILSSGPVLAFSQKMIKYILDNPDNDYYMSLWARLTREPLAGYNNSTLLALNGSGQQTNSYLFNVAANSGTIVAGEYPGNYRPPNPSTPLLGMHEEGDATQLGNKFVSLGSSGWYSGGTGMADTLPGDGLNSAVTGSYAGGGLPFGCNTTWPGIGSSGLTGSANFGVSGSTGSKDKVDSHIIYRFYLEDLTVSGRSYAEVDAISWAEYQKHVLTVGGRYYGDTFTNPTTIP